MKKKGLVYLYNSFNNLIVMLLLLICGDPYYVLSFVLRNFNVDTSIYYLK